MTTRKLKVWCETCEGEGKDRTGRHPLGDCTECGGDGFTLREVVELPDGRAVVVDAKAWEKAVAASVPEHDLDMGGGGPQFLDFSAESVMSLARTATITVRRSSREVAADVLAALFTGPVYEAEAVGYVSSRGAKLGGAYITKERGDDPMWESTHISEHSRIAVGLKEVGR